MARTYAGTLGLVAFLIALARGAVHAWGAGTILLQAWIALWAFAALGALLGWMAERIVDEEIRVRISTPETSEEQAAPRAAGQ